MIRYKDKEYKDYFINPYTAIIIDINGKTIPTHLHHDRIVVTINGEEIPVYCIQAHTFYGWRPDKVVHHIDGNHHNDVLFNLWYEWTNSQHNKYHANNRNETWRKNQSKVFTGRKMPEGFSERLSTLKKGNTNTKGRKWFNNGVKSIMAFTCPDGFVAGQLRKQ